MISAYVEPGTKIEMVRLKNSLGEEVEKKIYYSKIVDLVDEETVKISMPIDNSIIIPLKVGDKYKFIIYTKNGLFQCIGAITERFKEGLTSVAIVNFQSDVEKYQRRQYYRLECAMDMQYRVVSKEEKYCNMKLEKKAYKSEEEKEKLERFLTQVQAQWNMATIIDISGGGCRFNSKIIHEVSDRIQIKLIYHLLDKTINAQYDADIVYSTPLENRKGFYEYRVEFDIKDLEEREKLIKFIFEKERKIRKRERGLI